MTSAGRYYPSSLMAEQPYKPIESYGAIGNLRTVGLIGADGSLDWLCFPNTSGGGVFGAILDNKKGGCFRVWVDGASTRQRYVDGTNVLRTAFLPKGSIVGVNDFMPLWGDLRGKGRSTALDEVQRLISCRGRAVEVQVEWSPRPDYARKRAEMERHGNAWVARWGEEWLSLCGLPDGEVKDDGYGPVVRGTLRLERDEERSLMTRYCSDDLTCSVDSSKDLMKRTIAAWRRWVRTPMDYENPGWAREWSHLISRSELALKLLIHDDTGAILAAPTTSLPEVVGRELNWDYRYTWLRDASMAAQALLVLGHHEEAMEYLEWIRDVSEAACAVRWEPRIMYGIHGETDLEEVELDHLDGYRSSRPVRIGNGAAEQRQHEVYGELMSTGYELIRHGVPLDEETMSFFGRAADKVCEIWEQPDSGIWERRGEEHHYTYSKVMLWVALDRAIHMAEIYGLKGDVDLWKRTGDRIAEAVLREGYSDERGAFTEYFGSDALDAANLRIPLMEMLPFHDDRVQGTIDRIVEELLEGGMLARNTEGVERGEGSFIMCTFWLVQVLALSGRVREARSLLENASEVVSPLGLFAEMFDPRTGAQLGNFPQAFSHIGFINAVLYLFYAEGREIPVPDPIGSKEHRNMLGKRHVEGVDHRSRMVKM